MKNRFASFLEEYGSSLLTLILGLFLAAWPTASGMVICYTLGGIILVSGLLRIWTYFRERRESPSFFLSWNLTVGIVLCAIGLFFLFQPQVVLSILPVMLGILLLLSAFPKILRAIDLRQMGYPRWWIILITGAAIALLGVLLLIRPFSAASTMIRLLGICLLASGFFDLWLTIWVNRMHKNLDGGIRE